jgi:cytidyltransferase-like protein
MKKLNNQQALFIPKYGNLKRIIAGYKAAGLKIVLTTGVFDMIHIGHAMYTAKAKEYGDILVVGVDTNKLVQKDKGPSRPIVHEDERVGMMRFLGHIDIVTLNYTHGQLIRLIRPDVLVISESSRENAKNFERLMNKLWGKYCRKIVMLPPQAITSTTARVRRLMVDGAKDLEAVVISALRNHMSNLKTRKS